MSEPDNHIDELDSILEAMAWECVEWDAGKSGADFYKAIVTAKQQIEDFYRNKIPEKIKYVAEFNGIKIAVNEAVRDAGWQLKSKEEIEAYNQAIDGITAQFSVVNTTSTDKGVGRV